MENSQLVRKLLSMAIDSMACGDIESTEQAISDLRNGLLNAAVQHENDLLEADSVFPRSCYWDGGRVLSDVGIYDDAEREALASDARFLLERLGLDA